LLEQSFTVCVPLLMTTSALGLGKKMLEFSMVLPAPSRYPIISVPFTVYLLKCIKMIQEEQQQSVECYKHIVCNNTVQFYHRKQAKSDKSKRTAMYGRHPASLVFAMESISWPLMPKSHSLMLPVLSSSMLDGFTSTETAAYVARLQTQTWRKISQTLEPTNSTHLLYCIASHCISLLKVTDFIEIF